MNDRRRGVVMKQKILVINPGSTSTRVAVYVDEEQILYEKIDHTDEELERYATTMEQYGFRKHAVMLVLEENGVKTEDLTAAVGRGGMLQSVGTGAYLVNEKMLEALENHAYMEHASNLGAWIAYGIVHPFGKPAYIYDSPRADELEPIARISGLDKFPRTSTSHVLNSRAAAMKAAEKLGKTYQEANIIVAHLGGGISMSVHEKGRIIDILSDDEGPFSADCSGRFPARVLIHMCYSGMYSEREMLRILRGDGGLKSYMGTVDLREVVGKIAEGDREAQLVFDALAYQIAKGIGELSTVVYGEVDGIVLTGGMANSIELVDRIKSRISFLGPVEVFPGQYEMDALAMGTLRVLQGKEKAKIL